MKQFKRKLARLFGLALRSDLEKMHLAYEHEYIKREQVSCALKVMIDPATNAGRKGYIVSTWTDKLEIC